MWDCLISLSGYECILHWKNEKELWEEWPDRRVKRRNEVAGGNGNQLPAGQAGLAENYQGEYKVRNQCVDL